jgi:asparagine synthase (glutamine-hydrolysing)
LEKMISLQAHRGPDGEGYVLLAPDGKDKPIPVSGRLADSVRSAGLGYTIGFGHQRLAVIDRTPLGHQPMASEDGRCWVTYNGEIYNHVELRHELQRKGHRFRSASDTEVLLAAYREWGEACVTRLNGMFAFALWDPDRRRLFCARDRLGEKPFYYRWDGERFAFASEIKALLPTGRRPSANHRALFNYLDGGDLDDSDGTFFDQVRQLLPAHVLVVDGERVSIIRYWALPADEETADLLPSEASDRFRDLFRDAVRIRLRSDVAVGSCLSGGLDSSSIVCVANGFMPEGRQRTFSSCFEEPDYDERRFIRPVLERTGAEWHATFPDPKELADKVSELVWQQDEPFGSPSVFAQWTVMRLAAQTGVKVLLDGQGADELLGGYPRFWGALFADLVARRQWATLAKELRAYWGVRGRPDRYVGATFARALLPGPLVSLIRSRMTGSAGWIASDFRQQCSSFSAEPSGEVGPGSSFKRLQRRLLTRSGLRALLHYEDRNSMAFGIEARLPFLDHRLVEFLYGLNVRLVIRQGWTKVVLRDAMEGVLPEAVRWRTDKMGFVTPEAMWLRTSLREMVRQVLSDQRTRARGYLDVAAARRAFEDHEAGRITISRAIWRWLNLELWCRCFLDQDPCAGFSC